MGTSLQRINTKTPKSPCFDVITAREVKVCGDYDADSFDDCIQDYYRYGFDPDDEHYGYNYDMAVPGDYAYGYGFQYGTPPKQRGTTIDCDGIKTDGALIMDDAYHGIMFRAKGGNYIQLRAEEDGGSYNLVIDGAHVSLFTDDEEPPQTNETIIGTLP